MKIHRFDGSKLHGYLSFAVPFYPDLTFITGINGSGKTSAVRALTALLTPSIRELANMKYGSVSVSIEYESRDLAIASQRTDQEIEITCTGVDEPLRIPVLKSEAYESRARFAERQHSFYREQEALNLRHPVLLAVLDLPTPMFLDLERRYQAGTRRQRDESRFLARPAPVNPLAGSLLDSLNDAQSLAEESYRHLLARRVRVTDKLKQDIILTAFEPNSDARSTATGLIPPRSFLRQIEQNEDVVHGSLTQIGIEPERIDTTVHPFFQRVRDVARRLPTEKQIRELGSASRLHEDVIRNLQDWSALQPQVRQINRLLELISSYNQQLTSIFQPVTRYLNSANTFLSDSGKQLTFDVAGNLQVQHEDFQGLRPISALSSGERQVVVILTHLAFNPQAKRANVLIIDEPELSLHLRWQELFVDAVREASPGLQLILATHSPSIIKGRLMNCVDVQEARHRDHVLS